LAHQYAFPELEGSISTYLKAILNQENVCLVYDIANLYQLRSLMDACRQFTDRQPSDILQSDAFLQLSPVGIFKLNLNWVTLATNLFLSLNQGTLCDLLQRDSFCVPEVEIFRAVLRWWQHNSYDENSLIACESTNELYSVLQAVRLPLMMLSELLNEVRPSHLVSADNILDALKFRTESRDSDLPYRGHLSMKCGQLKFCIEIYCFLHYLVPEVNVAHNRLGAQVLQGEMRTALLDGDTTNYDMERGFTR